MNGQEGWLARALFAARHMGRRMLVDAGRQARHHHTRWRRQMRTLPGRLRAGSVRLTLGTRILLVLVAVATASTMLAVLLQDSALSNDLQRAARDRLQRCASMVSQLLDERMVEQTERYAAILGSPHFVGGASGGRQGLDDLSRQLCSLHPAAAILFLDSAGGELAAAGDLRLCQAVRQLFAAPGPPNTLLCRDDALFTVVKVPAPDVAYPSGSLVAVEAIGASAFAAWSRLCHGTVALGPPVDGEPDAATVRRLGARELRVDAAFDDGSEAQANSRRNLITGGMLGLALALAASLFLARNLVRPIRAMKRAAQRITAGCTGLRLDASRNDEVGDLARAFNRMLDNLEQSANARACVENRMSLLAYHDSLTGLPNRRLLRQRLSTALERAAARRTQVAVLSLDLDRFKNVNDSLGHGAGDTLLLEVACRLHSCAETGIGEVLLARLGGDEFTLVLAEASDQRQVEALAERVLQALGAPYAVRGTEVSISASLGIAMSPQDGQDVETLMRGSDMAMSCAKGRGGRGFAFYADSMDRIAARRLELEHRLNLALENGELAVFYQPKVDIETNAVTGVEALLRWRDAASQSVGPAEFVPLAEETGAIVAIGAWVLRTAMQQCVEWQRAGLPPVRMAVNVSPRQFEHRDDFVAKVEQLLEETGLDPAQLELEITEGALLQHEEQTVALFTRLRELGVGIALDDFGTGYSSLSYLRRLPIDTLKIDRSFLQGADRNPADAALVGVIIAMAKVLKLRTVVEGVETRGQRRFLEQLGCDEYQGYLCSPAIGADEVAALLARKRRRTRTAGARRVGAGRP